MPLERLEFLPVLKADHVVRCDRLFDRHRWRGLVLDRRRRRFSSQSGDGCVGGRDEVRKVGGWDAIVRDVRRNDIGDEADANDELQPLADAVARGDYDLVAVGRALIGDPAWVEKVREGRLSALRRFDRSALVVLI